MGDNNNIDYGLDEDVPLQPPLFRRQPNSPDHIKTIEHMIEEGLTIAVFHSHIEGWKWVYYFDDTLIENNTTWIVETLYENEILDTDTIDINIIQ